MKEVIGVMDPNAKEQLNQLICNILEPMNNGIYAVRRSNFVNFCTRWCSKVDQIFEKKKFNDALQESDIATDVITDATHKGTEILQDIRARILANEYHKPNSISLRSWEEIKKISADEFLWFEKEIAPFVSGIALVLPKSRIENNQQALNMGIIFTDKVTKYLANGMSQNSYIPFAKNRISIATEDISKINDQFLAVPAFVTDLCKICEINPWTEE